MTLQSRTNFCSRTLQALLYPSPAQVTPHPLGNVSGLSLRVDITPHTAFVQCIPFFIYRRTALWKKQRMHPHDAS